MLSMNEKEIKKDVFGKDIENVSRNVGSRIGEFAGDLSEKTSKLVGTSKQFIEENPMKSVAIAAATGLVVGGLVTVALRRNQH